MQMLDAADAVLSLNEGVPLASARLFRSPREPGVVVITTDASGVDGIGGFAFHQSQPRKVWLLSEWWLPAALEALQAAAAVRSGQPLQLGRPALSMPAAELFCSWAMGAIMCSRLPEVSAVVAVGDCKPACGALNKASSPVDQMRMLVHAARRTCSQWLAVHVHRSFNMGADELSHPANFQRLSAQLEAEGWIVERVGVPPGCWEILMDAAALGPGPLVCEVDA